MRASPRLLVLIVIAGVAGASACRPRTELATFDRCDRNPPDSVAPAPIDVRFSADTPGSVFVHAHASGHSAPRITAMVDGRGAVATAGTARFDGVMPGSLRLRIRSFGYGERDTLITLPADSSLSVDVALTRGGGARGCSTYVVDEKR